MKQKTFLTLVTAALLAIALAPAAFAGTVYSGYATHETRLGAYTSSSYASTWGWGQGFYDYLSPPIATYRYGAQYHWGSNIRDTAYTGYPTRVPNQYQPYYGYPFRNYPSQAWEYTRQWGLPRGNAIPN